MSGAYMALCAPLPAPTRAQIDAFVEHVCQAHSWYKHMPLMAGGEVVVFLAPDAGEGFSGEQGQTRLHYSWKTTASYRARFGYLDYCWRCPDERWWGRDAGDEARYPACLPDEVLRAGLMRLMPYCSHEFGDALGWGIHDEDVARLVAGAPHRDGVALRALLAAREVSAALRSPAVWSDEVIEAEQALSALERLAGLCERRAVAWSWGELLAERVEAGQGASALLWEVAGALDEERRLLEGLRVAQRVDVWRAVEGMLEASRCLGLWAGERKSVEEIARRGRPP